MYYKANALDDINQDLSS